MITLYGAEPMWGLPDPSPFVVKAELLLKIAGVPYQRRWANFSKAPKGKIPYIEDDGQIIPDSTLIRFHLEKKYGADFSGNLPPFEAGAFWAAEKMCEDHLYWLMVMERWGNPVNFERGPRRFFDKAPALMRPLIIAMVKRQVKRNMHGHGVSRFTPEERQLFAEKAFAALAGLLEGRAFAGGAQPCGADATLFAFILSATCPYFESDLIAIAAKYPVLEAYCARMKTRFYPEG